MPLGRFKLEEWKEFDRLMKKSKGAMKSMMLTAAMVLAVSAPVSYAANLSDLKENKQQIEQKKNELSNSIDQKSTEINTIENKQDQIMAQITQLNAEIAKTDAEITQTVNDINQANQEIIDLQAEIDLLQKKIDDRTELLEKRARAIQAEGKVNYLDVLLGANSFVDFIDRMSAVTTLIDADRQIMRDQKADQQKLEEQKLMLENTKKQLEENQKKLESLRSSYDAQKVEKNKLIDELEAEQAKLSSEKRLLEEEYSEAIQVSKELESQIVAEQNRLAEIARQQAAANGGGSSVANNGNIPQVAAGTWTKPANGRFTSKFGWRDIGFGQEFHYGIDIANVTGTPIVAAADGIVSYAGWMNGYGNVIMLTHSINGQTFATVYAHLSKISVSKGQAVSKANTIGLMGNTGRSFGSHLHFELHVGPWTGSRSNAVNPLRYIAL